MTQIFQQKFSAIVTCLLLVVTISMVPHSIEAQAVIELVDQSWESDFNDAVTFSAEATSSAEIVEADLFYRVAGQLATSRNAADFTPGSTVEASFTIDLTDPVNYQPPGTELEFWWKFIDADDNELKTEPELLVYEDDRHNWQFLENDRLTLGWYVGDEDFGQALFERANEALDTLEADFGTSIEDPIKIFIYGDQADLLDAMSAGAQEWTGGAAYTDYGVVVIGVRPAQLEWGLGAMTHEVSHLVIHQATDNPFGGASTMPRWLDEGIAVYNENREELDDDFKDIFDRAVANDTLLTLRTISSPFPSDPIQANLAYGQSGAVVKFMIDTYGPESMAELLAIFAEGALHNEALEQAVGLNMDQLDNAFRESLDLPPWPSPGTNIETEDVAQAEAAAVDETATEPSTEDTSDTVEDEATDAQVETVAEDVSVVAAEGDSTANESETAENSSPLSALPCLAGLLMTLLLFGAVYGWRVG